MVVNTPYIKEFLEKNWETGIWIFLQERRPKIGFFQTDRANRTERCN